MMRTVWILAVLALSLVADTLTFGVFAYRPESKMIQQYQPLVNHLEHELNVTITLKILSQEELEAQVKEEKIDIVATNPTHFIALRAKGSLTGAIATEIKNYDGVLTPYLGGVILTRSDRSDIKTLADLRGKSIAIPGKKFLGGYQTQNYELSKEGITLPDDATLIDFQNHDAVVDAVVAGKADAGFIRTGIIEEMSKEKRLRPSDVFVINEQHYPDFPLKISTALYPEWAIACATHEPMSIVKQIASALYTYTVPKNTHHDVIHGFTIPADYSQIDSLARILRLPPYENPPNFTLEDVWAKYDKLLFSLFVSTLIIFVLVLFLYRSKRKLYHSYQALNKSQQALADLAVHDPLTALFNRRGLHERLSFSLANLARNKKYGALIYLDLDNFKPLNDAHGHAMGDALLVKVAKRLTKAVRAVDTVARMGGDEFVVLLSDLEYNEQRSAEDIKAIAEKILAVLGAPYRLNTGSETTITHHVTASIGLVHFDALNDADAILNAADAAMYTAKAQGKNQIVFGYL